MLNQYNPEALEVKWYTCWEQSGAFQPVQLSDPAYCIMLPPPNVTGSLHMGHAFQDTLMDYLIRVHRMKGYNTLWQAGTDHAGIATQMLVERNLLKDGVSRHSLGRDAFINKVWEWKTHSGNTINNQMRQLGASPDWSTQRFTLDEGFVEAVQESFVRLYRDGLIYRGKKLVNWDPILHTALSDLEVITEEAPGHLWHIRYPIENSAEYIHVATTRPETLLGDQAVAVHPDDVRYQHLIGKFVKLPLTTRTIPIIADPYVDPLFGSGCVKITPAHDFNDFEIGKRHRLICLTIFDVNAHMNENAPVVYQGLDRFEARKRIIQDLKNLDLLEKIEDHIVKLPKGDRSGVILEPYLTDQWYVKTEPLAKEAIEALDRGEFQFVPNNWSKTYLDWMNRIQDWCISRQLWWGHQIPAWYDTTGAVFVGKNETEVRAHYQLSPDHALRQDEDVLDTWFSASIWPFATLGWPHKTPALDTFYPTQVLVTGFDIIFFWVARMVMMGLKLTGKVPFKAVYVHGLIQDAEGQKMSKSKGNNIDPLDLIHGIPLEDLVKKQMSSLMQPEKAALIEKHTRQHFPEGIPKFGTDALRFTLCALATNARHIRYDFHKTQSYQNFCNKLWNAARYVLMNTENKSLGTTDSRELSMSDQWIRSTLQTLKITLEAHLAHYRFDLIASSLYDFTWNVYCDWYLELAKPILTSEDTEENQSAKQGTRHTLLFVLDELVKLLHPIIPYITEEIWQHIDPLLNPNRGTRYLINQAYPTIHHDLINPDVLTEMDFIQTFITAIRNVRGEMTIAPSKFLTIGCSQSHPLLSKHEVLLKKLAKLSAIQVLAPDQTLPVSITIALPMMQLFIPMSDFIDTVAECARLNKALEKITQEITKSTHKLANASYIEKAKPEVVAVERQRLTDAQAIFENLTKQLTKIQSIENK